MTRRKKLLTGLLVVVFTLVFSQASFAENWHHDTGVKALREAAALLQATRPDLAQSLIRFADQEEREKIKRYESRLKLLRDSAVVLQTAHPALAQGLNKFANHKDEMMRSKNEGRPEAEKKGKTEMKADYEAHIGLLRDSAAVIQPIRPDLAKGLTRFADHKAKELAKTETEGAQ